MSATPEPLFTNEGRFEGAVEVIREIFRAEDDGYAILEVRDGSGDEFVVTGTVAHLTAGEKARLTGGISTNEDR